jgi:hypothetical protein
MTADAPQPFIVAAACRRAAGRVIKRATEEHRGPQKNAEHKGHRKTQNNTEEHRNISHRKTQKNTEEHRHETPQKIRNDTEADSEGQAL